MPCVTASRADIAQDRRRRRGRPGDGGRDRRGGAARSAFGGQTVAVTVRESARDALIHGRWDPIGELLEGAGRGRQGRQPVAVHGGLS